MKAIIIKDSQGKAMFVAQVCDLTTTEFLKLEKEAKENMASKIEDAKCVEKLTYTLDKKVCDLDYQIKLDRGEVEGK